MEHDPVPAVSFPACRDLTAQGLRLLIYAIKFTDSATVYSRTSRRQERITSMMQIAKTCKRPFIVLATAMVFAFSGLATAQEMAPPQGGQQGGGEMQEMQQRLSQIQRQAFENNPQLQEQAEELENLFIRTMEDAGYDPENGLDRLDAIQARMQDESVTDDERQAMLEEAQEIQMELQEGQQVAMQDQAVIDAQTEFEEDLMDAMRAEDPETDELISRFEQMQQQQQPMQ